MRNDFDFMQGVTFAHFKKYLLSILSVRPQNISSFSAKIVFGVI
ncbi:Hypothetical protein BN2458_PEG0882 [Helicobacter typhlonius]|uniref:Uncharacterized protein n=1 Tax=Helicobacter typhlonius TaxID=76936 RepID=A0A0S4PVR7_9HELI|nr:Hypothetical protein BN2458_PEG0882 [Helicobacter typhlonius]